MIALFQDLMSRLPQAARSVDTSVQTVAFEAGSFPSLPELIRCPGISVFKRQVYRGHGSNDSLRLVMDRAASTSLGLWILGATLQRRHADYVLELANADAEVRHLICRPEVHVRQGVEIREARFHWAPGELATDLEAAHGQAYLSQRARLQLVNDEDDWADELANRKALRGFGPLGGACRLAAFFLDFGLGTQQDHYACLKDDGRSELLDPSSCEVRVELPDAWQGGVMRRRALTH